MLSKCYGAKEYQVYFYISPAKTAVSHSLLQGTFPTQVSSPDLLNCTQIFYHLSHQGRLGLQ